MSSSSDRKHEDGGSQAFSRREWLAVLAQSDSDQLEILWNDQPSPPVHTFLRRPETGLALVRGRTGGSGAAFNLGEMTITRCTVGIADSVSGESIKGTATVAGRSRRHAELVALFDAVFQDNGLGPALRQSVLPALRQTRQRARAAQAAKAAATKVEFFTMERGR